MRSLRLLFFCRSPNHGVNNGRSPEPRVVPPCKPPPSRPPVTPSIDELSLGHGGAGNNISGNINTANGTPTNVPKSNSSHSIATPTGRQPKSVRYCFIHVSIFPLPFFQRTNFFRFVFIPCQWIITETAYSGRYVGAGEIKKSSTAKKHSRLENSFTGCNFISASGTWNVHWWQKVLFFELPFFFWQNVM